MYNGSQYRASISSIQAGGRQGESAGSTIRHTMQVPKVSFEHLMLVFILLV